MEPRTILSSGILTPGTRDIKIQVTSNGVYISMAEHSENWLNNIIEDVSEIKLLAQALIEFLIEKEQENG